MRLWMRQLLVAAGLIAVALGSFAPSAEAAEKVLRIGVQKYGKLILLRGRGTLEKSLEPLGYKVTWSEFPAGPQLLEAMNAGAIDFGNTGEAPPIFAQAAAARIVYVAHEPAAPRGEAILVQKDSPINTVAGLKGKRVAFNKGSNVHFLLVKALEKAGLSYTDIQPVYLTPADARAAFERGAVDAWAIWDPFLAAAEIATDARAITSAEGIVPNYQFYLSSREFAEANPKAIEAVIDGLRDIDELVKKDVKTAAAQLGSYTSIPAPIIEIAIRRQAFGIAPMDDKTIKDQQLVADTFHALGLIPKHITVADAIWRAGS
jgi:sulfonate transport system substrate-binding protein